MVIAERPEAGPFAGRVGVICGWTKPSKSRKGPVYGNPARVASDDFAGMTPERYTPQVPFSAGFGAQ